MKKLNESFLIIIILFYSTFANVLANPLNDKEIKVNNSNPNCELVNLKNQFKYDLLANNFSSKINDNSNNNDENEVSRKSPWLAFFLSYLIPGGGQWYNGDYTKAIIFESMVAVGVGLLYIGLASINFDSESNPEYPKYYIFSGGLLSFFGWLWSMIDAPMTANRINQENQKKISLLKTTIFNTDHFSIHFDGGTINNKYSLGLDCKYEF